MGEPKQVLDMAKKAAGEILRWREEEGIYIVLLTDGRKLKEPIQIDAKPPKTPRPTKPDAA